MPDIAADHLIRPEHLCDGAIELDHSIDIRAVNIFWRGGVYQLVARPADNDGRWRLYHPGRWTDDLSRHADHLEPHPYDERFLYDRECHFIVLREHADDGPGYRWAVNDGQRRAADGDGAG